MIEIRHKDTGEIILRVDSIRLSRANLRGANLQCALLDGADLANSILTRANLSEARLAGANLKNCDFTEANLSGADLTRADLFSAQLRRANLNGADLTGASLPRAILGHANAIQTNLRDTDLHGANLDGADLTEANLQEAVLAGASLSCADLSRANLTGADLTRSVLNYAVLKGADLTRADLTGADLSGADLTGANLTGTVLADTQHTERTRWPAGFLPHKHRAQPAPSRFIPDPSPERPGVGRRLVGIVRRVGTILRSHLHSRTGYPQLDLLVAAWSATMPLHQWEPAAALEEIAAAEAAMGRPLPPELRALYSLANGFRLFTGSLNFYPLDPGGEPFSLVHASDQQREWQFMIPDELVLFGNNGGEEHFGLWLPQRAPSGKEAPVIEVGEIFEPGCMAIAGTNLVRFLKSWTVLHLNQREDEPGVATAFDLLGVPQSLRSYQWDDLLAQITRWSDPTLPDPNPDPYEQRLDADQLRERYGA